MALKTKLSLLTIAFLLSGCGTSTAIEVKGTRSPSESPRAKSAPRTGPNQVIGGSSYHVIGGSTLNELVNSKLTATIVYVEVVEILPDRRVIDISPTGGSAQAVYTPIQVRITKTMKGGLRVGEVLTLRALGGSADGLTYFTDTAPRKENLHVGDSWLIVGGEPNQCTSETEMALTPSQIYIHIGGERVQEIFVGELTPARAYSNQTLARIQGLMKLDLFGCWREVLSLVRSPC